MRRAYQTASRARILQLAKNLKGQDVGAGDGAKTIQKDAIPQGQDWGTALAGVGVHQLFSYALIFSVLFLFFSFGKSFSFGDASARLVAVVMFAGHGFHAERPYR